MILEVHPLQNIFILASALNYVARHAKLKESHQVVRTSSIYLLRNLLRRHHLLRHSHLHLHRCYLGLDHSLAGIPIDRGPE